MKFDGMRAVNGTGALALQMRVPDAAERVRDHTTLGLGNGCQSNQAMSESVPARPSILPAIVALPLLRSTE